MKKCWFLGRVGLGACSLLLAGAGLAQGPAAVSPMPRVVEKDGRWALMVDGAPYLMLGDQVNN